MSELPAGLRAGPLTREDAAEATRLWRACELHDDGAAMFGDEDFVALFKRPSFDAGRHSIAVRDGGSIVALAILYGARHVVVHVLPEHRGRGIGTWLADWTQQAGRAAGNVVSCQSVSEHEHAAAELLRAAGYEARWESWNFAIELAHEPDPPVVPEGYALRPFAPGRDDRAVHRVIDDAFSEWEGQTRLAFEDWAAERLGRPGFAPEHIAVAVRGEEIVGAVVMVVDGDEAWVGQLAVARPHRRRGLARALLVAGFGIGWRAGLRRCGLDTDSRTGARGLYEHVGMHVTCTFTDYAKAL